MKNKNLSPKKKRVVLLDSHAIIHRAYHALPDFTSSDGEATGALYGLAAMLLKTISELKPDYIIAAYDLPGPTHRHDAFDEYKAGREKMDVALSAQIERSRDMFEVFSIPIYEKEGFEADDIIGTVVEKLKDKKDVEVIIASGDMDTLQLVDKKRVTVYTLRKGISDTVIYDERAVKDRYGFGPNLLPDFKGLMGDPSDNIPGVKGVGEKTATELIQKLGSIEDIYKQVAKGGDVFEKKGFKTRTFNLLSEGKEEAQFSKMLAVIRRDAPISFSLPQKSWRDSVNVDDILKLFRELSFRTLSERAKKYFDVKEDVEVSDEEEEETFSPKEIHQTGLALWVLDSNYTNPKLEDILAFAQTGSFKKAQEYIFSELKKQELEKVYKDIELQLIDVVKKMKEKGARLDTDFLNTLSKKYHTKLDSIEKKIFKHAKHEFNVNSPKQLAEVLYDELGLSSKGKTAKGQRSTREGELTKIKDAHPIISEILSYREIQKLLSTYIDALPRLVSPADGRLHADWLQAGAATGRMASQNPNLQNIPIRSELGKVIRNAFVAEEGFSLIALDYSQIELRLSAILSGDKKLLKTFKEGGDVHSAVAKEVFGNTDPESRRKAKVINFGIHYGMGANALAKTIGTSPKEARVFLDEYYKKFAGVVEYIENTKLDASRKGYTETLFGRRRYFPGLSSHLPYVRAEAERQAQNAPIQGTSADVIKIAMKRVDDWIAEKKSVDDISLVLQIHDELVYEVKTSEAKKIASHIKEIMEGVIDIKKTHGVPLIVDVSVGKNWGETKKIKY